jgi:hypothetical protein
VSSFTGALREVGAVDPDGVVDTTRARRPGFGRRQRNSPREIADEDEATAVAEGAVVLVHGGRFSLLGAAPPATLRPRFDRLSGGRRRLLAARPGARGGATDGKLTGRHGIPF